MSEPDPCEDPNVVRLPASATIAAACDLREELSRALDRGVDLELDGADVSRVDVTALQLVVALRREAERRGVAVRWRSSSDELRAAAVLLDLGAATGLAPHTEVSR